jgi:hypothetical protein
MNILWIGTKPPVPPVDGGRLAVLETLRALHEADLRVTLVAPVDRRLPEVDRHTLRAALEPICRPVLVPSRPAGRLLPLVTSLPGAAGTPYAIARHRRPEVARTVERLLSERAFDVVHCEQLHALAQAVPGSLSGRDRSAVRGLPVVLRAQNVESDLWAAAAALHPWAGPWIRREARRLARHEGAAVRSVDATVALTRGDARTLERLAGGGSPVAVVPPPFPAELPPAEHTLAGTPAVVLLGSGGWLPNEDAVRWFVETGWPAVLERCPEARLHLYAPTEERVPAVGVELHSPPKDSREAFPPGSIQVVPLRIASGIRMKILEAWARGVPVVSTPEAAAGLEAVDGRELLIARTGTELAGRIAQLVDDPDGTRSLREAGHRALRARHEPAAVAAALTAVYRGVRRRDGSRSPR